jgi:hypothetical protein
MVAATFASLIGWTLGYLLLGLVLYMVGTRIVSELRIWWARQTGRGSCRFCGRPLTIRVAGLLRIPDGFFGVCAWGADVNSQSRRSSPRDGPAIVGGGDAAPVPAS